MTRGVVTCPKNQSLNYFNSLSSLESYSQSYLFSLLGLEGQRVVALALSQGRSWPSFVDLHRDVGLDRRVREEVLHEGLHRVEGVAALLAVVPTLRLLGRLRSLVVVACRGLKVKLLTDENQNLTK